MSWPNMKLGDCCLDSFQFFHRNCFVSWLLSCLLHSFHSCCFPSILPLLLICIRFYCWCVGVAIPMCQVRSGLCAPDVPADNFTHTRRIQRRWYSATMSYALSVWVPSVASQIQTVGHMWICWHDCPWFPRSSAAHCPVQLLPLDIHPNRPQTPFLVS